MGGSAPAQTQQTSQVKLPAWVEQASQENYQFAKDVAGRPLEQYGGPQVAAPSDMTTQGYGMLQDQARLPSTVTQQLGDVGPESITKYTDPYFEQARGMLTESGSPLDVGKYMNPYTNEVESRAIGNATTALQQQLRGVSDTARKSGAFGGSRSAVESGVTRAEGVKGIGDLSARLRQAGFDTATSTALADRSGLRSSAAGLLSTGTAVGGSRQANQQSAIVQQQAQMAKQQQDQQIAMQNITALLTGGQQQQGQRQAEINAAMKQFYEKRDYPIEQLNTRLAALGMSPYGKTESSTKTATSEQQGPDWATIGLGAFKTAAPYILPAMLSDREMKTDIEKLGKVLGVDMYAYRYKGDPKSYPKVVGPMAQDIEKKHPAAVKKIGGKRVVDLNNLMEALA